MTRLCLDTSAYSHFKRGDEPAVRALSHATWIGVPSIVLGELRAGFALGLRTDVNEAELDEFLAHPVIEILDVDDEASRIYASIVVALRRAGTTLPTNDVWIATLAARSGSTVLTYDRHFESIPRIGARILEAPKAK